MPVLEKRYRPVLLVFTIEKCPSKNKMKLFTHTHTHTQKSKKQTNAFDEFLKTFFHNNQT